MTQGRLLYADRWCPALGTDQRSWCAFKKWPDTKHAGKKGAQYMPASPLDHAPLKSRPSTQWPCRHSPASARWSLFQPPAARPNQSATDFIPTRSFAEGNGILWLLTLTSSSVSANLVLCWSSEIRSKTRGRRKNLAQRRATCLGGMTRVRRTWQSTKMRTSTSSTPHFHTGFQMMRSSGKLAMASM